MDALAFATLALTGFVACAEFGSYAFVHPVLRRLPATERIRVEQGLLKTFGRVMPVGMPLSLILAIAFATRRTGASPWTWIAVAAFATATLTTLIVNVPVNWPPEPGTPSTPRRTGRRHVPAGSASRASAPGSSLPASSWCAWPTPEPQDADPPKKGE